MKRFITYVYAYDHGTKDKNVGFIKVDVREPRVRMEVQVRNLGRYQGAAEVYLLIENDEKNIGILSGTLPIYNGSGKTVLQMEDKGLFGSQYDFSEVIGVRIQCGEENYLASCWEDGKDNLVAGAFFVWKKEKNTQLQQKTLHTLETERKEDSSMAEEPPTVQEPPIVQESPTVQENEEFLEKIDLTDIRKFPKKNWYLCNNSFLIHGFFNYHYLVLKKVADKEHTRHYLGVPGIYEKPERMMALLFGFPEFEKAQEQAENQNPQPVMVKSEPVGEFGYWYCPLDM